jgi:hypothetical protein
MVNTTVPIQYFPTLNYTKWLVQSPLKKGSYNEYKHLISTRKFLLHATSGPPTRQRKSVHNRNYLNI